MEFQNLIEKRRSVRKYVERNTVTKDEILSMIKAAQEAPSWKNSQTGRYYCIMDEKNVEQFRRECLPEMNAGKCENAVLLVSTFVHNRAGFQKDGTADNEIGNGWGCYDLGLQNENLILKAEELGYGTLIMGIRDADKIREFCSVPETETVVGAEWSDYVGFGSYSDNKYMFIMDVCQRVWDDLEDDDVVKIQQAYKEYIEAGNPPILGDDGDEIEYE